MYPRTGDSQIHAISRLQNSINIFLHRSSTHEQSNLGIGDTPFLSTLTLKDDLKSESSKFCQHPLKNEIRKLHFLSALLKNLSNGSKYFVSFFEKPAILRRVGVRIKSGPSPWAGVKTDYEARVFFCYFDWILEVIIYIQPYMQFRCFQNYLRILYTWLQLVSPFPESFQSRNISCPSFWEFENEPFDLESFQRMYASWICILRGQTPQVMWNSWCTLFLRSAAVRPPCCMSALPASSERRSESFGDIS